MMDSDKFIKNSSPCQVNYDKEMYCEIRRGSRFFYADEKGELNPQPGHFLLYDGHISEVFTGRELAKIRNKIAAHFATIESERRARSRAAR